MVNFLTIDDHNLRSYDRDHARKVIASYKVSDMDTSGDPMYFGYLSEQGRWYILELNLTNGTFRYEKGDSAYTTAWTNRASGSYDYFDNVFPPSY